MQKLYILELELRYYKKDNYFEKFFQIGVFNSRVEAVKKGNEFIETNLKNIFDVRAGNGNRFTLEPFYINLVSNCIYEDKIQYFFKIREIETDFNNFIKDIL